MKDPTYSKTHKIKYFDLTLYLAILVSFGALEYIFAPSILQPVTSLALGVVILAFFWRRRLATKYTALRVIILSGSLMLINMILLNLHATTGYVEPQFPWPEIDRVLEERFSGTALIAVDGKVYLEKSYSYADRNRLIPNTPATKFMIGSTTKQFTAMGILILRDQGKLELGDSICQYLPNCSGAWQQVNIEHLLTHTSGIGDPMQAAFNNIQVPEGTGFVDASFRKIQGALKFFQSIREPVTASKTIEENKIVPLEFVPGEKFRYSNLGYVLLGYIIENVSGKSYEDFIKDEIFIPLQMSNSGYGNQAPNLATGYINSFFKSHYIDISRIAGAGGIYSTVGDLYKWDQALYGEKLVKKETLDEIFAPRVSIQGNPDQSYAYGWVVGRENGHPVIKHGGSIGGYLSYLIRYPEDKITIILLSNDQRVDFTAILSEVNKALGLE